MQIKLEHIALYLREKVDGFRMNFPAIVIT